MMTFDGCLMENIDKFKEVIEKYNEEIEKKKRNAKHRVTNFLKIERMENSDKWFLRVLKGKRVVGVDGSQMSPLREFGIPIGIVQVAKIWVVHGEGKFGRSFRTTFVELDENLDLVRFKAELEMLMEDMDGKSWLFFDGSFTPYVSDQNVKENILKIVFEIVRKSEETETPLVGYVDRSFSKDLAKSLGLDVYDTYLLSDVMDVFSYTQPLGRGICYCYLMVNPSMPVRIEFPEWMKDMHEELVKTVFAECLLGKTRGYPYILERAHQYSCIDAKTRASFMKAIKSRGISFKWMSKWG